MMETYNLLLKNEKVKSYDSIAVFILLIQWLLFTIVAITASGNGIRVLSLIALFALVLLLAIYFNFKKKKITRTLYLKLGFLVCFTGWILLGQVVITVITFFLGQLYMISGRQLTTSFLTDGILINSFPKKHISWAELNHVILKDGLLTLDFRNNKVIQSEIIHTAPDVNEEEFNDFCRSQLSK